MGVSERAAAFLGHVQGQAVPGVQQMNLNAQNAGQGIANLHIASTGQVKNQAMNSMPLGAGSLQARTQQLVASLNEPVRSESQANRPRRLSGQDLGAQHGIQMPPEY